ncbi:MAG: hypothetical protein ACPL7J_12255 [Desulfomonilaceae bacterium]
MTIFCSLMLLLGAGNFARALDIDFPIIHRYPPGYYGAGYYSKRLYPRGDGSSGPAAALKWDKFMSHELGIEFPFFPMPYPWDYGRGLTFNFPDFNANDWR